MANVYIILLNWNGWQDTIQCLESILHSNHNDFRVVVCDNDSSDGSLARIKQWADGEGETNEMLPEKMNSLISPAVDKPLAYVEYNHEPEKIAAENEGAARLILIQTGSNGGFAVGNNVGIRYAIKKNADYIWLLNNDTLIEAGTLTALNDMMVANTKIGALGSVIRFAKEPYDIQTYGGGRLLPLIGTDGFVKQKGDVDYIAGTSLFVRTELFQKVGLLDEGFFFYWEDVDFSTRAKTKGWQLDTAEDAVVYHKFSATVVSQSLKSDLFKVASLRRYFRKHYSFWARLMAISANIKGMLLKRIFRGQFNRIIPIIVEAFKRLD
jgi:GT2 family glycosyltransferase